MRSKFRRWAREIAVLLVLAFVLMWLMDQFRKPSLPVDLAATSVQTIDGETRDLAALSEARPLLVYVWASWCGVCRYTTPSVERLAQEGGNVMSIALRSPDIARWVGKKALTMPVVDDARGELSRQWQINVTPTIVVISKGEVVSTTTGWTSFWGMKLRMWWAGV